MLEHLAEGVAEEARRNVHLSQAALSVQGGRDTGVQHSCSRASVGIHGRAMTHRSGRETGGGNMGLFMLSFMSTLTSVFDVGVNVDVHVDVHNVSVEVDVGRDVHDVCVNSGCPMEMQQAVHRRKAKEGNEAGSKNTAIEGSEEHKTFLGKPYNYCSNVSSMICQNLPKVRMSRRTVHPSRRGEAEALDSCQIVCSQRDVKVPRL